MVNTFKADFIFSYRVVSGFSGSEKFITHGALSILCSFQVNSDWQSAISYGAV
jgi:hypothetical protein